MRKCLVATVLLLVLANVSILPPTHAAKQTKDSSAQQPESESVDAFLNESLDTPVQGAENDRTDQFQGAINNQSSGSGLVWFFIKVGIALGIVIAGIWLVSKLLQKSGMTGTDSDVMGVRSTLPLGQNQYLQIVQVGSQYFMLGVTENQINLLDELTDNDVIRSIKNEEKQNGQPGNQGFGEIIKNAIGVENHQFNSKDTEDYLDELQQKINRIGEEESTS